MPFMLRQLRDALRFALADFFDVPRLGILVMLAVIALLVVLVWVRTTTSILQTGGLRMLLGIGVLIALWAARDYLRR